MRYTDKIYGTFSLSPLFHDLFQTDVVQRLKRIHQGGAIVLLRPDLNQTRFEHSVGVMLLIRQLGGSEQEQVAGLLHDIPHTAFSHLIDYVLELETEDFHETRYAEVIQNTNLAATLTKYNYHHSQFLDLEQYKILEYPLPYLCADRIDYTLRDLFQLGKISIPKIKWFVKGLRLYENRIVTASAEHAHWFQQQYDYLVNQYFNSDENRLVNRAMKTIVKDFLLKGYLTIQDFYEDDFFVIEKMERQLDSTLSQFVQSTLKSGVDLAEIRLKKRCIDPEVLVKDLPLPLSQLNITD
ncbi:MAG: HD domain-containing protein [Saprospiraceae bacterium]